MSLHRREVLAGGAAAGLLLGFRVRAARAAAESADTMLNAWLRISPDESITVILNKSEMGQGVLTALPQLVAEELRCDWSRIKTEFAPASIEYTELAQYRQQATGGSSSVTDSWDPLRQAGADAREMLIAAAAARWKVAPAACRAEAGAVLGPATQRATYGVLASDAGKLPVPKDVPLGQGPFHVIGQPLARLDVPSKVDGSATFGIDVVRPGMLIATVAHCPVRGGKPALYDEKKALAVAGVKHVVKLDEGVAVVADGWWPAKKGLEALLATLVWDEGPNGTASSESISKSYAAEDRIGHVAKRKGKAAKVLASCAKTVEAVYEVPFLAHATMEPQNCTADVGKDLCQVWGPIQAQTQALNAAARASGFPKEKIKIHTTLLGGGFGRRLESDFVEEAVTISRAVKKPVKMIWSREEDIRHDFYRPVAWNRMTAGLDDKGAVKAWHHRVVGPSIVGRFLPALATKDPYAVDGAEQIAYDIPAIRVEFAYQDVPVPVGPWRSVGNSQNAFVVESFLDEVAAAAGKDPVALRRELLAGSPRHLKVLDLAAEKAGWGTPLPDGVARGVAVHKCFGSYVAEVAEVKLVEGEPRVTRVVCAVDCGPVVNPAIVESQVQGAVVFGLSAALWGKITLEKGRVQQSNFHDYKVLRMKQMPLVEVHLVESTDRQGGIGEPAVPPIAPAVCNALFALTGKRIRKLPITLET